MNPTANRIWEAVKKECRNILAEGAGTPDQIDSAWLQVIGGKSIGPCEMMDSEGLDTTSVEKKKNVPTLYFLDIAGEAIHDISKAGRTGRVLSGGFDGRPLTVIAENQLLPDGIDISQSTGRLYWTNMGSLGTNDGHIHSSNLDGSDLQTVIAAGQGIHSPKQLTIDQTAHQLYFCDREGLRILRCNLDGSALETLIQTGDWHDATQTADQTRWCTGIALDVPRRHLYWTQKGPSKGSGGRIFRAGLHVPSGEDPAARSDIETLFQRLPECIDLDLDTETSQLYWSDRGELPLGNTINRAYVGPDRAAYLAKAHPLERMLGYVIMANQLHEAIGIKLDKVNRHVYVTDLGGTVYRFGLNGEGRRKTYQDLGVYTGIAIAYA